MLTLGATFWTTSVRVSSTGRLTPSSMVSFTVKLPLPSSLNSIENSNVLSAGLSHSGAIPLPQLMPIRG